MSHVELSAYIPAELLAKESPYKALFQPAVESDQAAESALSTLLQSIAEFSRQRQNIDGIVTKDRSGEFTIIPINNVTFERKAA